MGRPTGPRHPPDKRHEAYESIFGRPSTSHHLLPQHGQYYHPPHPSVYHQPGYQPADKRTSHAASIRSQQSYYSQPRQSQQYQHPSYHHHHPQYLPQHPGHALVPPSTHGRAPSVVSSPHNAAGIIAPRPGDPPNPDLDALTRAGLTPARAYLRAKVNILLFLPQRSRATVHPSEKRSVAWVPISPLRATLTTAYRLTSLVSNSRSHN
ncbi:hypothetical protein F5J12DRAFT_897280 [Pisolithus orientalis]|uniref:uncharacterized protein n=1 Tax=Pisolithus orientalis TaxID=936130 RepID=UPI00222473AF|nr:uncharacterized protein F5J12DRAFT_897280 [Pisolithus orientalis]KAI5992383.1 hypothetical protein F5J12DRAFT_897280 [Pisolithus orientalis]